MASSQSPEDTRSSGGQTLALGLRVPGDAWGLLAGEEEKHSGCSLHLDVGVPLKISFRKGI